MRRRRFKFIYIYIYIYVNIYKYIYPTVSYRSDFNLLIAHDLWKAHYQNLSIIFLKYS